MATVAARLRENAAGVTVFLVLGAGLLALGLGYSWFWVVFAVGFAVLLPLVGMLTAGEEQEDGEGVDEPDDPLEILRDRYARGELTEEEFERRVETLLETETEDDVVERIERERN